MKPRKYHKHPMVPQPPLREVRERRRWRPGNPWARRLWAYHTLALPSLYWPRTHWREFVGPWIDVRKLGLLLGFLLCVVLFLMQASVYWEGTIDDAFITFRFVDQFVQGNGWRFNPNGPRVEGFTNFLWAALLVVPHALKMDLMFCAKLMGLASGVATMAFAVGLAKAIRGREDLFNLLPAALLAVNAHFAHWALMGMETLLQTALVVGAYWRFELERRDPSLWPVWPFLAFLATMTRPDSMLYLAPLFLYGLWMIADRQLPAKRLLMGLVLFLVPFLFYQGMRLTYFGELYPNTYYAKQRLVVFEGHARGLTQLFHFYFDQAPRPALETSTLWDRLFLARWSSAPWILFWALSLASCVAAMFTGRFFPAMRRARMRWLREPRAAQVLCLVLLPWAASLYLVYHVNGDWMPGFRFLLMALPFIGVAGAVGFGWFGDMLRASGASAAQRMMGTGAALVLAVYALAGTGYEQLRINAIYVFGPESYIYIPREPDWYAPAEIARAYQRGFVAPLGAVAEHLLLHTQDDAAIFTGDIGQPLWFADHLTLYDADGLVDPRLAHAPSTRGDIATAEELLEEEKAANPKEAARMEFDAFVDRNASWLMEEVRPEYLLLFISHGEPDPDSPGFAYPAIGTAVQEHPGMAGYRRTWTHVKMRTAYNHLYVRNDVAEDVPDHVKLSRLYRTIARNPRMPVLIGLLYRTTSEMPYLSEQQRERINGIIDRGIRRWKHDPMVMDLARSATARNDFDLARRALEAARESDAQNSLVYWGLASIAEKQGDLAAARAVLEEARTTLSSYENYLYHSLAAFSRRLGDHAAARDYALAALERDPDDGQARRDLELALQALKEEEK